MVVKMAASMLTRVMNATVYSTSDHLSRYSYWKQRYQQQGRQSKGFDWFLSSEEILDFLINNIQQHPHGKNQPISCLDLGCGTSNLAGNILSHSCIPVSLVLLDFVWEALQYQKYYLSMRAARMSAASSFQLVCADVMFLPFKDDSFHMAVDKGTMDALLKDTVKGHFKADVMMSEVKRVTAPGGRFLQISDEDPDTRMLLLEELNRDGNDAHILTERKATLDTQLAVTSSDSSIDTFSSQTASVPFSSWSFKVIPSRWSQEYFIFWADK